MTTEERRAAEDLATLDADLATLDAEAMARRADSCDAAESYGAKAASLGAVETRLDAALAERRFRFLGSIVPLACRVGSAPLDRRPHRPRLVVAATGGHRFDIWWCEAVRGGEHCFDFRWSDAEPAAWRSGDENDAVDAALRAIAAWCDGRVEPQSERPDRPASPPEPGPAGPPYRLLAKAAGPESAAAAVRRYTLTVPLGDEGWPGVLAAQWRAIASLRDAALALSGDPGGDFVEILDVRAAEGGREVEIELRSGMAG